MRLHRARKWCPGVSAASAAYATQCANRDCSAWLAIAVIPLSVHFAASILSLAISNRKTAAYCLALPVPALFAILLVLAGIVHALIGFRSVVLDHVGTRGRLLAAKCLFRLGLP